MVRTVATLMLLATAACSNGSSRVDEAIFSRMGAVYAGATPEEQVVFERGRDVALRQFSRTDGLGPDFNVTFCGSCHEKPDFGGSAARYRNFLLVGDARNGTFTPTGVNGVQSQYSFEDVFRVPTDAETNVTATRNAIPFFGVGFLAEIPDSEILALADPDDSDGDGISGRPNYDRGFVGRLGRKSQVVSVEGFIRGPLFNHLGITTNPLSPSLRAALPIPSPEIPAPAPGVVPVQSIKSAQAAAAEAPTFDADSVPDPELDPFDLFDLVSFTMLLGAPAPSEQTDQSLRGRNLFMDANCSGCHVPSLTGPRGPIPAYTDLLLHDMGPELADGIIMNEASGSEFRTQPLWGVVAVGPYLHDGRADTLDEAIRMHGGEAQQSRDTYVEMSDEERQDVLAFLASLGGADQVSSGLIPPDSPLPPEGTYGGPMAGLDSSEVERFERGRRLFDRDFSLSEGVGPLFNGDSCRACHFAPAVGGSGPDGVNVTRHGIVSGPTFAPPSIGTMAHKFSTSLDSRPVIDESANCFEHRQTPPVFGLGLIDQIPEANILANEDPADSDMDGISGRAHIVDGGRVGRFGWKAGVPNLAEFARDAMTNELGVSVADQPGLTFGSNTDADATPDPEISVEELEDLTFFMSTLAPPPRNSTSTLLEDAGELVFDSIGCSGCHVSTLDTAGGDPVALYSDLLLHDVAPAVFIGIEDGDASMREFRTAPLWGLPNSAPYMHDGHSPTIEDAILRHDSEAASARDSFTLLSADDRRALMAFLRSL